MVASPEHSPTLVPIPSPVEQPPADGTTGAASKQLEPPSHPSGSIVVSESPLESSGPELVPPVTPEAVPIVPALVVPAPPTVGSVLLPTDAVPSLSDTHCEENGPLNSPKRRPYSH